MIAARLRHAAIVRACPDLADPARSLLFAGADAAAFAQALGRALVATGRRADASSEPRVTRVPSSPTELPFVTGAFDTVICADVLQCLAPAERSVALDELLRVARRRVVLCVPAGAFAASAEAAWVQDLARGARTIPEALRLSQRHGIPSFADFLALLLATGRAFTLGCNETVTAHYAAAFVDEHPFLGRYVAAQERKFPAEAPLVAAEGDLPWSYFAIIDVDKPRRPDLAAPHRATATPAADAAPVDGTTAAATATPAAPSSPSTGARRFTMFAAGHRLDRMPELPGIEWIFAGAQGRELGAKAPRRRDDAGAQISARNPAWSEMTALYWLWRNVGDLDAVGFCQYRRYFDFRPGAPSAQRETYLASAEALRRQCAHFVDRAAIDAHLDAGAIVVARPMALPTLNPEQYAIAHVAEHYLAMVDYVLGAHPGYAPQVLAQARDRRLYGCNMFAMPWQDFDRLCDFWFDCLFGLEVRIPVTRTGYHGRVFAFLSERIFDLHIRRLADAGRRLVDYPIFCLDDGAF